MVNNNGDVLWWEYNQDKTKIILKKYINSTKAVRNILTLKAKGFVGFFNPTIDEKQNTTTEVNYEFNKKSQ